MNQYLYISTLFAFTILTSCYVPPTEIQLNSGSRITGTLEPGDRLVNFGGAYCDYYSFQGTSGQRVSLRMISNEFDPLLRIFGPNSFEVENDDESEETVNSYLSFILPANGIYTIQAASNESGMHGSYAIIVNDAPSRSRNTEIQIQNTISTNNGRINGELNITDDLRSSGRLYDEISFVGEAGELIIVRLSSIDFVTSFMLRSDDFVLESDSFNTEISSRSAIVTLPESGEYQIVITSFSPNETGSYLLNVSHPRRSVLTESPVIDGTLEPNITLQETLERTRQTFPDGQYYQVYSFTGTEGQIATIEMGSVSFDPYLLLSGPNNFVEQNDDIAPDNMNSLISVSLPETGTYHVYASSFARNIGRYAISLSLTEENIDTNNGRLFGTLQMTDDLRPSGQLYDEISFVGEAGELITINLLSNNFNTHFMLNGNGLVLESDLNTETVNDSTLTILPESGEYQVVVSDDLDTYLMFQTDDLALENNDLDVEILNSSLTATLPESGEYQIIVTSDLPGVTGSYFLNVLHSSRLVPAEIVNNDILEPELTLQETLEENDPNFPDGQHYRAYSFTGTAGQIATIEMGSAAFDTYLLLSGPNDFVDRNDNRSTDNTNSLISVSLPETGTYHIYASSFLRDAVGNYAISLSLSDQ